MENLKKIKVLCIGVGDVGQHHLSSIESYFKNRAQVFISAVDPAPKLFRPNSFVRYYQSLDEVEENSFDIALINTKSDVRAEILERVLKEKNIGAIYLEKLLFRQMQAYEIIRAEHPPIFMWTSVRIQPLYCLANAQQYDHCTVELLKGSLITDLIHYIDYFFEQTQARHIVMGGIEGLQGPFASKRSGNLEFEGELSFLDTTTGRSVRFISSEKFPDITTTLIKNRDKVVIDEQSGSVSFYEEEKVQRTLQQRLLYQSEMTGKIIWEDISLGKKKLIPLGRAIELHKAIYFPLVERHPALEKFFLNKELPFT